MNLFCEEHGEGLRISSRDAHPGDYICKIQSFSLLSKHSIDKYDSATFESEGYKWILTLYPNGNKKRKGGKDHVSLYLTIVDSNSLPSGWEVNTILKFFLFDQIRDKNVMVEVGSEGRFKRFHGQKKEWGCTQFIPIPTFNDPNNGFLVDDSCFFGVEIEVISIDSKKTSSKKTLFNGECLSMVIDPTPFKYTWKLENLSKLTAEVLYSDVFIAGGKNWKLWIYPKGYEKGKNNSLSLFLNLAETLTPVQKMCTNFKICLRDQRNKTSADYEATYWFVASSKCLGWSQFIGLECFKNEGNGYLVNDTCFIDAEVTVLGSINKFT